MFIGIGTNSSTICIVYSSMFIGTCTLVYSRSEVANVCLHNSRFVQATDLRQGPF